MSGFRRILVPVDFSAPSASALRMAGRLAKASGGIVDIVHVYPFRKGLSNAVAAMADFARDGGRASHAAVDRARAMLEQWREGATRARDPRPPLVLVAPRKRSPPDRRARLRSLVMGTRGCSGVAA
jgi:nucleotide-binding universal stress UspA family protein